MGFRNGSTCYINNVKIKGTLLYENWEDMPSHYLATYLQLLQQPTVASFSSYVLNPLLTAQSAILLLYSAATHHVISTRPNSIGGLYFF